MEGSEKKEAVEAGQRRGQKRMTHLEKLQCLGLQIVAYSLLFSLQPVDHPNFVSALIMQYTDHISSFVRASLVLLWKHCLRGKKKKKKGEFILHALLGAQSASCSTEL